MGPICLYFDSYGLFTQNISMGKKLSVGGQVGGHQSGTVNYFFRRCFRKNWNCGQYLNDKPIIFCVFKIWDRLSLNHDQNNLVGFLGLRVTRSSNKPWFCQFFEISEKNTFRSCFWYNLQHEMVHDFKFFPGGVTINISLGTLPKKRNFSTFWIFIQSEIENINHNAKLSD